MRDVAVGGREGWFRTKDIGAVCIFEQLHAAVGLVCIRGV